MTEIKYCSPGQILKIATSIVVICSLVACAAVPTEPVAAKPSSRASSHSSMAAAATKYNTRDFSGAFKEFDTISSDDSASANSRRLAHLGKALVYLGKDAKWHSLENAKMSLVSAGAVVPDGDGGFDVETDLLMDAVSAVIGSESKFVALKSKSGNAGAEVTQLKEERDALAAERDGLLAEQEVLNEALEKLKKLTLGN